MLLHPLSAKNILRAKSRRVSYRAGHSLGNPDAAGIASAFCVGNDSGQTYE